MAGEMWLLAESSLGQAIKEGDPYNVRRMVESGENVMLKDRKGNTYLHYISTMHKPYVFNILVAFGVPINAQNRDGNTALHVTALHSECCHVPDLMQCGIDPYITNKAGKLARDIAKDNTRWLDLHEKYEPTLRLAIKNHDIDNIKVLFQGWAAVHYHVDIQNGFNMRQFAAAQTYHDIVAMIDQVRFSLVKRGHPHHMLQHAIRLKDLTMVDMLLEAEADVNTHVYVHEYIRGPLFFEVLERGKQVNMELVRKVLAVDVNLNDRDERGRTALMYCIDKRDGDVTMEVIELLLQKGINIALRDNTGLTARDIALFARRHDIVSAIDQYLIGLIRQTDMTTLTDLAVNSYQDIFIQHMYRDTWIYACGNEDSHVTEFLHYLQQYWIDADHLLDCICSGDLGQVKEAVSSNSNVKMLLKYRDKGGRGPLLTSILYNQPHITLYLLTIGPELQTTDTDNCERCCMHYVYGLGEADQQPFLDILQKPILLREDVCGIVPEQMTEKYPQFISQERKKDYGMEKEVHCMQKYEQLLEVIRSKTKTLKHFNKILKTVAYPVADFHAMLHPGGCPLVTNYRDLLHCAVGHHKEAIVRKLVHIKLDCSIKEKYTDCDGSSRLLTAAQGARELGMEDLADYIATKGVTRTLGS